MNKKQFDLTILPLKENDQKKRLNRDVDDRLPNVDNGICVLLLAPPRQGKSLLITNMLASSQFLKHYFSNVYLIGGTIKNDKSLRPLVKMYESTTFDYLDDNLVKSILEYQNQFEEDEKSNMAIVVDDCIALPQFQNRNSSIARLSSNYRHILRGRNGGGMLLFSSQKLTSIPTTIRSCANVIILGRTTNIAQRKLLIDEYADSFGGQEYFNSMMNHTFKDKYSFLCLYIDGNNLISEPCAYKNFTELLYPNNKIKHEDVSMKNIKQNKNVDLENNIC
jgi:hypothetical protein